MSHVETLRGLISGDVVVDALGVVDPVGALLARRAGAEVLYLSGAVASAVELARPDLGFLAASDVLAVVARLRRAVDDLPIVVDADTGFGNEVGVMDTVRRYREAGIAALHLEDQVAPKRCGHQAGKQVVSEDDGARKIEAAVAAAAGEILIIARTDAASIDGVDAAIARARRYADAGADLVFIESVDDAATIRSGGFTVPVLVNRSEAAGEQPLPDRSTLAAAGVRLMIHPVSALLAQVRAAEQVYAEILGSGAAHKIPRAAWSEVTDLLDLPGQMSRGDRWAN